MTKVKSTVLSCMGLGSLISLRAQIGSSRAALRKVAREERVDQGAKYNLGTARKTTISMIKIIAQSKKPTQSGEEPSIGREQI